MNISKVAKATGLTAKTIRYYESIGLISAPVRSDNGYRSYTEGALRELRFVERDRLLRNGHILVIPQQREERLLHIVEKHLTGAGRVALRRRHVDRRFLQREFPASAVGDRVAHADPGAVALLRGTVVRGDRPDDVNRRTKFCGGLLRLAP